jgi:hypothetical protein
MSRDDSEFTRGTPVALPEAERQRIEADIQAHIDAADALILSLDVKDGDADFEPSLGSLDRFGASYGNPGGDQTGGRAALPTIGRMSMTAASQTTTVSRSWVGP